MRASHPCDFALLAAAVWSSGSRGRFVSRIPSARERCVLAVEWAAYAKAAAIEDVGVDHGRAHIAMAEQLLDGADVVAVFQHVGSEGMPHGVGVTGLVMPAAMAALRTARWMRVS